MRPKQYPYGALKRPVVVQRIEDGSRCEYHFRTLSDALCFVRNSKRYYAFEIYKQKGGAE